MEESWQQFMVHVLLFSNRAIFNWTKPKYFNLFCLYWCMYFIMQNSRSLKEAFDWLKGIEFLEVLIKFLQWQKPYIFPIWAILKQKSSLYKKNAVYSYLFSFQRYSSFEICKLANWGCHTLNQILIKYGEERYPRQFVSEMFDSLQ